MKHIYSTLFLIFSFLAYMWGGYMHEEVHRAIYSSYGINSEIHLFKLSTVWETVGERPCPDRLCESLHSQNEIVSYNLDYIFLVIFTGFYFLILFLEMWKEDYDKNQKRKFY